MVFISGSRVIRFLGFSGSWTLGFLGSWILGFLGSQVLGTLLHFKIKAKEDNKKIIEKKINLIFF